MNKALIIVDMYENGDQSTSLFPLIKYVCKKERKKGTKVILSYGRLPSNELNWDGYDIICEIDDLPKVIEDSKINVAYFGGLHWGHCVAQHAFRLDSTINGINPQWNYLPGSVNWEDVGRERQVKVDCLNFVLNLTMTHPHQGYERITGWNQIFSMMKDYDKKYYLWGDENGFEEVL